MTAEESRSRLFGFVQAGAEESDLPSFAAALDQYMDAAFTRVRRYTQMLEAALCRCQPERQDGEYLHEVQCPVADVQMEMSGCFGFEDNPVAPDMCAGCHQPKDDHAEQVGLPDEATNIASPHTPANGNGVGVAASAGVIDRRTAIREAIAHVRSLPVSCTGLAGPIWYGDGWKSALDKMEDFAERMSGQGDPDMTPVSSEEFARLLNEAEVWWTKGVAQTWEKLPERLGKSRYRAIAHQLLKKLFVAHRGHIEEAADV